MRTSERLALSLCLAAVGCAVYVPSRGGSLTPGRSIRVTSATPMTLGTSEGLASGETLCKVSRVDGRFDRELADTLVLSRVHRLTRTSASSAALAGRSCPVGEISLRLVRTAGSSVAERRISRGRTTLLVVSVTAVLAVIAAYAAGLGDIDLPPVSEAMW